MTSKTIRRPSRRSPSFSSSSSSSSLSFFNDSSTPTTPLRYSGGIPFSWEQFPGIPKKNNTNKPSSHSLLPLPPSGDSFRKSFGKDTAAPVVVKKYTTGAFVRSFHEDPFFAAFVECSKDDDMVIKGSKMRSSSGFSGLYGSCFRTCEVAQSIVYLPRSRSSYLFR